MLIWLHLYFEETLYMKICIYKESISYYSYNFVSHIYNYCLVCQHARHICNTSVKWGIKNWEKKYILIDDERKCANIFTCNDIETRTYIRIKDKNFNICVLHEYKIYRYIYITQLNSTYNIFKFSETIKILDFFTSNI